MREHQPDKVELSASAARLTGGIGPSDVSSASNPAEASSHDAAPASASASTSTSASTSAPGARPFVGVQFACCNVYLRIYRSADGKAYRGRCPRCGIPVNFTVGEGGTDARTFVVR